MDYNYRGILKNGKTIRGTIDGRNKREVVKKLKLSHIQPIRISVKKKIKLTKQQIDSAKLKTIEADVQKLRTHKTNEKKSFMDFITSNPFEKITQKDLLTFTNSLYILKKAKFSNIDALDSLYATIENPKFKDVIDDILIGVEAGATINEMMLYYPKVFPAIYVNFVKVGEESGSFDQALLYARDYTESSIRLRKQIKGILLPKVLLFVFVLIITIVGLIWGTPLIQNVYDMFGSTETLPKATQVAVKISEFIIANWYFAVALIVMLVLIFVFYYRTPYGRYQIDKIKIKFPIFGRLSLNIIIDKFFRAMLLNIKNGLRIQDAIDVSKTVTDNYYFLSLIEIGKNNLLAGGSWLEPFEQEKALPPIVIQMVTTGMKTDLAEMMEKVAEYIQQEIQDTIDKTVKALPEIMYVFIGLVLVLFTVTILVPLMNVYMGSFLFSSM